MMIFLKIKFTFRLVRFYKAERKVVPEIQSVAEFMAAQLGDCTGDKDNTFMTLRVSISHCSTCIVWKDYILKDGNTKILS